MVLDLYLGISVAFAKLRKTIVICVIPVCLSVRPSVSLELGFHWTDFREVWYMIIFLKSVEKIKV